MNASGVTGNVYLEFSAENASFGTFTSNNASSVVGSYATDIKGNVDIVINSGSFSSQIMSGIYANANNGTTTIGGATHVYVNGGSINGDVMGGGLAGSISGGSNATVTGGVIAGSVYGAGKGGSIREGSAVRVTGGTIKGMCMREAPAAPFREIRPSPWPETPPRFNNEVLEQYLRGRFRRRRQRQLHRAHPGSFLRDGGLRF